MTLRRKMWRSHRRVDEGTRVKTMLWTTAAHMTMLAREGGNSWFAGALTASGIALLTVTMLRGIVRQRKRAAQKQATRGDTPVDTVQPKKRRKASPEQIIHATNRDSLDRLMVEVQELTRVCAAQLENRSAKLELLIAQADERIQTLAKTSLQHTQDIAPPSIEQNLSPSLQPASADDLRDRIRALSKKGRSAMDISREINEPVGKVELIMALQHAERTKSS